MAGMLQIITYLLAFYLIVKGVEILQIALASNREHRAGLIAIGVSHSGGLPCRCWKLRCHAG